MLLHLSMKKFLSYNVNYLIIIKSEDLFDRDSQIVILLYFNVFLPYVSKRSRQILEKY